MKKTLVVTLGMNTPLEAMDLKFGGHKGASDDLRGVRKKVDYVSKCRRCVEDYLEHTNFDILVGTNEPNRFKDLGPRVHRLEMYQPLEEYEEFKGFNEYYKLQVLIDSCKYFDYDVTYYVDGDNGVVGWDQESWDKLISKGVDVWGNSSMNKNPLINHSRETKDRAYEVHTCKEDRLIFTNRKMFEDLCKLWSNQALWDRLFRHREWRGMGGGVGCVLGESMKLCGAHYEALDDERIREQFPFTKYECVYEKTCDRILTRWWNKWNGDVPSKPINMLK